MELSSCWYIYAFVVFCTARCAALTFKRLPHDAMSSEGSEFFHSSDGSGVLLSSGVEDFLLPTEQHIDEPEVVKFHVQTRITGRYASTVITSKLHNWKDVPAEAEFPLTLPDEAFISDFYMIVGGTIYRSEVKEKEEAQRTYDKAKDKGQTAGQVKQKSPKANEFGISVNVAANQSVTFNVTYQQLLSRRRGVIEHKISTTPGQVIDNYKVDIYLTETQGIQFLEAGWRRKDVQHITDLSIDDVIIDQQSIHKAHISFTPSRYLQLSTGNEDEGFNGDVVLRYDVNHDLSAGELQVMNGYFVHYFSPEGLPPVRKRVVFVIDVSGSMDSQGKLDYTREALRVILDDLKEGDRFNIVTFESAIEVWKETMLDVTPQAIEAAKTFVEEMVPLGYTNLHGGIMEGVRILREDSEISFTDTYPMIIMLTDGLPSAGVTTDLSEIRRLVKAEVDGEMSLFTLGFGEDVDGVFLEQLALENQGVFRKIYVDSSATLQLTGFYDEVATPLLYNIDISYTSNAIEVNTVTQTNFISYFQGTELVVAGKLSNEIKVLSASVLASSRLDNELELNVSANAMEPPKALLNRHTVDDFAQRLWAYKTIKLLLDQMKIAVTAAEREALKSRALELSLKYHFVTPLTSLVVVKPKDDIAVTAAPTVLPTVPDYADYGAGGNTQNAPTVGSGKKAMSISRGGGGGGAGGGGGGGYADSDPHFLVHIPANNLSVCFDITGKQGEVYDLLTDEQLGFAVHGTIVSATKIEPGDKHPHTYFGTITIYIKTHLITLSPSHITIDDAYTLSWEKIVAVSLQDFTVAVTQKRHVEVYNGEGVSVTFVLHKVRNEYKADHFGLYVNDGDGLSYDVHGLIGQFQYKNIPVIPGSIQISDDMTSVTARLAVDGKGIHVLMKNRQNALTKKHQPCWFAKGNGRGLLEGRYKDYVISQ